MKATILALLGVSSAVTLTSIPSSSIMQNQPSHWRKIWPQGLIDDGLHDDTVINYPKRVAPARAEHDWVPYESHTVSMENQWTGLYHTTGPALVPTADAPKVDENVEAEAAADDGGADAEKEVNEEDFEEPADILPTKGAKARQATIDNNPDLQPEVPTGPLVQGAAAAETNAAPKTAGTAEPEVVAKGVDAARAATK